MLLQWLRQLPVREADDFLPGHNLCANHVQCDQYGIGKLCEIKHTVHSVCSVVMFTLNKRGMSATMEQRHWKAQMRTIPTVTTFLYRTLGFVPQTMQVWKDCFQNHWQTSFSLTSGYVCVYLVAVPYEYVPFSKPGYWEPNPTMPSASFYDEVVYKNTFARAHTPQRHTCAHTHKHTHTNTHTNTRTNTNTRTHACTHTHTCTHTHMHRRTHTHRSYTHTVTFLQTSLHNTHTNTGNKIRTHTLSHACILTYTPQPHKKRYNDSYITDIRSQTRQIHSITTRMHKACWRSGKFQVVTIIFPRKNTAKWT